MTRLFTKMQAELRDTHRGWGSISQLVTAQSHYHSAPGIEGKERKRLPESGEMLKL